MRCEAMHVLFVHKNFPAQFGHVAQWLVKRHGWKATYVSELPNADFGGLKRLHYKPAAVRGRRHIFARVRSRISWLTRRAFTRFSKGFPI